MGDFVSVSFAPCSTVKNRILAALSEHEYERLSPHLETVFLGPGEILYDCLEPLRYVYFPIDAVILLLSTMEDGATTEVGVVGSEGMLGVSASFGVNTTPNQAMVLVAGRAVMMRTEALAELFDRGGPLRTILLRYMQALFIQVSQTAACNRAHQLEGRLCRWLLMIHDRLGSDILPLTQEVIANMLGTRRPYVTVAAGQLHKQGMIHCHRGQITIIDRQTLEARACECYRVVKREFDHLLGNIASPVPVHRPHDGVQQGYYR